MALPHLHIFHPQEIRLPGITEWLADLQVVTAGQADWDSCVFHTLTYDLQAAFNLGTALDRVRRNPGPIILVQKVQGELGDRLIDALRGKAMVYRVGVACSEDLWSICETARQAYEDGEPRIPLREVIAHLIIRKLARQDMWGGTSLNKSFLWAEDLPNGGFPRDICDRRVILDVAEQLVNYGILTWKKSEGQRKYALASKAVVQPILDSSSFSSHARVRALTVFFEREPTRVTARILTSSYAVPGDP